MGILDLHSARGARHVRIGWRPRAKRLVSTAAAVALLGSLTVTGGLIAASSPAQAQNVSAVDAAPFAGSTLPAALCTPEQQRATERFWRFGATAGIDFGVSGAGAKAFTPPGSGNSVEGSTVITDTSGTLLFWSNGATIFNRNDAAMSNGSGLAGNPSATQTVAAFPLMFQPGKYVVATTSTDVGAAANGTLSYSVVDMALDGGLGAVEGQRNRPLGAVNTASEALTAIPNADGTGFWVLTYTNNSRNALAYEFDGNGYTGNVVTSVLPTGNLNGYGTLSLSPDRSKLLASTNEAPAASATGVSKLRLLDFNAVTGKVVQTTEWAGSTAQGRRGYSADFSPNGDYVYFSRIFSTGGLFRYKVANAATAAEIKASEIQIGRIGNDGGQVKRAPDGRMYVASRGDALLSVVNNPDAETLAEVAYQGHGFKLPLGSVSQFGLPQMVTGCLSLDFGDAPDSYGTLLGSNGPVHSFKSGLTLGTQWDEESNGQPSLNADGDDLNGAVNDEDGVATPIAMGPGRPTVATVAASNTTGAVATLAGWIDLNGNGTFEANELQRFLVPANSGTANYTLAWPAQATVPQGSFARFRLFAGEVAAPSPFGSAVGGEVEDYPVHNLSYTVGKSVSSATALPGDTLTYTVSVKNTGNTAFTAEDPALFADDLSAVLDDAADNGDATGGAIVVGGKLSWSGALAVGETKTITYSVTVNAPISGDQSLVNSVVPGAGGSCDPAGSCTTVTEVASFSVVKSSTAKEVVAGEKVPYTITVTNTGKVPYTAARPASFTDDLSKVLDDASYNNDADQGATFAAPVLSWSGALAVGESKTIRYSVDVNDPGTGDKKLDNAVVTPPNSGGDCPAGTDNANCVSEVPGKSFTVEKKASAATAAPGDTMTYTVTVTNTGETAFTAEAPASFSDDLRKVLDDATYNNDATNGAVVAGTKLSWSGALAPGESKTITYSVTVNKPATGDGIIRNTVIPTSPGGECATVGGCTTVTGVQAYTVAKSSSPAGDVAPGDKVTYTVSVKNTGKIDYTDDAPASFTDDLAKVLDDASYNNDAGNGATVKDGKLSWSGALKSGETVNVTYSVTVNAPATGDHVLENAAVPNGPGGSCATDCAPVVNNVSEYTVAKKASAASALPGETVSYTVTVTNTGAVDYTAAKPASFSDDLAAVLDDASYNNDASNGATYQAPVLAWSGALGLGETKTITYSVTVNNPITGDHVLRNTVVTPVDGGCTAGATAPGCGTETAVAAYKLVKTSDATEVVPGDTVTYTVTVTNIGAVPYTGNNQAAFTDDLSLVLDDAAYNNDASNGASYTAPLLSWQGDLAVGDTKTITYSLTVNTPTTGDGNLENTVVSTVPGGTCPAGTSNPECSNTVPGPELEIVKKASADTAIPGDTIEYTITLTNRGAGDFTEDKPASFTDDLSAVLDDADYNGDASNGVTYTAPILSWSGALASGDAKTFTYSVTVNSPATGDRVLRNVVTTPPGVPSNCQGASTDLDCTTTTKASTFEVAKTVSAATAKPGGKTSYAIAVTNTGQLDYTTENPASFTDDMSKVLNNATFNNDASNGAVLKGNSLIWAGPLPAGTSTTITYSVTVNKDAMGAQLVNVAVAPADSGAVCQSGTTAPDCSTTTKVDPPKAGNPLANTGTTIGLGILGPAVALLLVGGTILLTRRTRSRQN